MYMNEDKVKALLVERLGYLAESIILRKDPFETVSDFFQVTPYLRGKYLEYKSELDEDLKQKIDIRDIDFAKYLIQTSVMGYKGRPFSEHYPEHKKTAQVFEEWIREKEHSKKYFVKSREPTKKLRIDVNRIIKAIVLERKNNFIYDKTYSSSSLIVFSSKFLKNNKTIIFFDKGSRRSFLDVFVGLETPAFNCDIANFFGRSQSEFRCRTEKEAKEQVHIAIDIIDILLPSFTNEIEGIVK